MLKKRNTTHIQLQLNKITQNKGYRFVSGILDNVKKLQIFYFQLFGPMGP